MIWNALPLKRFDVETRQRSEMVELTELLQRHVSRAGVAEGMLVVYVPHTTAAVTINENADPDVKRDLLAKLDASIPKAEAYYRHAEGNSDSHLKAVLTGSSVTVLVEQGRLVLGQWQGVYFCEFDGPRKREVLVKLIGDTRAG